MLRLRGTPFIKDFGEKGTVGMPCDKVIEWEYLFYRYNYP